jgi:hydroxymethylpyrimidine pyrophosphatase-like HAD family hydrolase
MIYIDVDGTLTNKDEKWGEPNYPLIQKVKRLINDGKEVIIWSGNGRGYALAFCTRYGINPFICLAKPKIVVDDNPHIRPKGRMNIIHPSEFLEMDV